MSALSDLHYRLGQLVADPSGRIYYDHDRSEGDASVRYLDGLQIEAVVRPVSPVALPDTPDMRALQDDWDETERLIGEAQKRYASHHNRALFKLECRRAIKRED